MIEPSISEGPPKRNDYLLYFHVVKSLATQIASEYSLDVKELSSALNRNQSLREDLVKLSPGILTHFSVGHEYSDRDIFGNWIDCSRDEELVVYKMYYQLLDQSHGPPDIKKQYDKFKAGLQGQSDAMEGVLKYCQAKTVDSALDSGFIKDGEGLILNASTNDRNAIEYLYHTDGYVYPKIKIPSEEKVKLVTLKGSEITVETDNNKYMYHDVSLGTKVSLDALPYFSSLTADFKVRIENGEIHASGDYGYTIMWKDINLSNQEARLHVENGEIELITKNGEKQKLSYPQINSDDLVQTNVTLSSEKFEDENISGFNISFLGCNEEEKKQAREKLIKLLSNMPASLRSLLQEETLMIHGQRSGQRPGGRASASQGMHININLGWLEQDPVKSQVTLLHEHQHNKDVIDGINQIELLTDNKCIPVATICHGYVSLPLGEAFSEVSAYASSYMAEREILKNEKNLTEDQRSWLNAKIGEDGKFILLGLEMLRKYPLTNEAASFLNNAERKISPTSEV